VPTRAPRLILAALVAAALPAPAADPPTPVEKLVEQLGSPQFPVRERATKALRERGPAALPALRKAMESKDEEVRKRAETLIPPLEIEEALLPKRVTVKGENRPLDEVLRDIEKQTGYKLGRLQGDGGERVTVPGKDVPFWDAVERIAHDTRRSIGYDPHQKTVQVDAVNDRSEFVNVRGPFRLEATWFHEDRDVDFTMAVKGTDGRRSHKLTLSVSVLAEPRITFLKIHPARVDEALDSDGRSLLDPSTRAPAEIPAAGEAPKAVPVVAPAPEKTAPGRGTFRGESTLFSDVRLRRASESARTAKVIRGTIPVQAILIRKPVVVGGKLADAAGVTVRSGADSLVVTEVQNQGGNNVMVSIRMPADHNGGQQREWHDRFRVEDDAGNVYQMNGRGTSSDGKTYSIQMYYAPPFNKKNVGPPTKLIFEDWVVHDHAIPFEFRDVPLP
jgi:hypothetical protein